ncbi:MAG TPA: hypothetical protein PLP21_13770 [Pyrinomonadaceae bacterium]|nr:hypothetical protein [Acidobacteriota bacterium]HQZ97385.1 hypothetical protein [Pyrinomonadaceae bacterium]
MRLLRVIVVVVLVGILTGFALAQTRESDSCKVDSVDLTTKEELGLGTFNTTVGKDLSTIEPYRIRGTKLFLVARVLYTDESMENDESTGSDAESISLQLWIVNSKNATAARESRPPKAQGFAEAQQAVATFNIGRVTLIGGVGRTKRAFLMKCSRGNRTSRN